MSETKTETVKPAEASAAPSLANVPVRKCKLEDCLPPGLLEMAKLAPNNPVVRGSFMAVFGTLPPAEADTFDKLRDWAEYNCTPKIQEEHPVPRNNTRIRERNVALDVEVDFSDIETGHSNYTVNRYGQGCWEVTDDEMRDFLQDAESVDDIVSSIANAIEEDGWELDPEMEADWSTEETTDRESDDHCDSEINFNRRDIRTKVVNWLRQHGTAGQIAAFGITTE